MAIGKERRASALLLVALLCALLLAFFSTLTVHASSVAIDDQANVLDHARVQTEAAKLPTSVLIYTTRIFVGEQDAFDQVTRQRLPNQRTIAIGIDVVNRQLSIESGTEVELSDSQASDAVEAFRSNFKYGDFTGATLASLSSLHGSLTGADNNSWLGTDMMVLIILGILGLIIFFVLKNRRNRNGPPYNDGRRHWDNNAAYYAGNHSNVGNFSSYHGGGGNFGGGSFGGGAGGSF